MSNLEPSAAPAAPKLSGRVIALGIIGGAVLVPLAVFLIVGAINTLYLDCEGAEGSLDCVLRQLAITGLSIPVGAPLGFFLAYGIAKRRARRQTVT